jgi:hypothetical protein
MEPHMSNLYPNRIDDSPSHYSITGTIMATEGVDRIGIRVQAFARSMPSVERRAGSAPRLLGEAIADSEGRFRIGYTFEQFDRGEVISPNHWVGGANTNVSFRVFDRAGRELTMTSVKVLGQEYRGDQIIFNVPPQLQVSIEIEVPTASAAPSEYEQLIAALSPVIRDVPLVELSNEDVAFIYEQLKFETGSVAPQRIAWLRRCAWLGRETRLPTEAFYGWGRKNLPAGLAQLLSIPNSHLATISEMLTDLPEAALRSGLLAAIDEDIVPSTFRGRVNEFVRLLKRRAQVRRSVTARLRDETSELPLAAYTVTVFDRAAGDENRGMYITDRAGMFSFDFYHSHHIPAGYPQSEFRLEIRSPSGDMLPGGGSLTVSLTRPQPEVVQGSIRVPNADAESRQLHFRSLMADASMAPLKRLAEKQGIRTFADVRMKGGLNSVSGPKMDPSVAPRLEALADLDRISPDLAVSDALLKKKFKSVSTIAHTPQPEFVAAMTGPGGPLSELEASKLHLAARAQTRLLDNMLVERAANAANGFRLDAGDPTNSPEGGSDSVCNCSDCEAAVSPAAYLAALLDYALEHIRRNTTDNIDLQFLVDTFHQPFRDLPTDCGAVDEQLVQARICVEALRSFLGNRPLSDVAKETALAKSEADVYFAVYSLLLTKIGTSYEEIRRARTETTENRRAIAERLGISLTEPRPPDIPNDESRNGDELDQLFLNPEAQPTEGHLVTALAIENLFGFADTSRDPLSRGAKFNDDEAHLKRWNLQGVKWNQNTDPDGAVYVTLGSPSSDPSKAGVYRDAAQTHLVASGELAFGETVVKLLSQNNSGLTAVFDFEGGSFDSAISITAIPRVLSWKFRYLRTLWSNQDNVNDLYSDPTSSGDDSPRLPIIDPDLIGPDDFRNPAPKLKPGDPDRAFDFWLRRRAAVDDILGSVQATREASGLTELLQQELGDPRQLDTLVLTLTKGGTPDEVSSATGAVEALHLSIESFIRLMALRAKDLAASDPRNEKITTGEWSEVYSILTQARKSKMFVAWRAEEKDAGITLGFEEFWFSLSEPQVGAWPPVAVAGQPLIDPDLVKLTDLPEWLAGKDAITLWNARKEVIEQIPVKLKQKLESDGFDEMLKLALGDPDPGDPLPDDLNTLRDDLNSPDSSVRDGATKKIETDLHLTVESFNRLILIKAADDQSDPAKKPTASQLAEVYALLTPARKIKHEYPQWIQEEVTTGLLTWQAVKARLPLWRASLEYRQAWQQGLRDRTRQPIIDPWLMGADDLQHVIKGDPAFDLWEARYGQSVSLHDEIEATREAETDPATALSKIIKASLGFDLADLEALEKDRLGGQTIDKRLDQLNLADSGFAYLMRINVVAKATAPILDSEWETVYNTLTQAILRRKSAVLRADEQTQGILLGPDFFVVATELSTPLPFLDQFTPPWLSVRQARSDWQDTLQSRIDQQDAIQQGLDTAIGAVEQLTLPVLRDALIQASAASGTTPEEKGEWITARLLIDARVDGCQMTTRVAQAIETLQTLIFDLRTGQIEQRRDWIPLGAPAILAGSGPSASSLTVDGRLDGVLTIVGEDHRIYYTLASGTRPWTQVAATASFTIPAESKPVLFCFDRLASGAPVGEASLFAVGNDGHINASQLSFGSGKDWSPWAPIGGIQVRTDARIAVAAIIRDELLHAFVVQDDGQVFGNWQDTNWHDWAAIGNSEFRVDTTAKITAASTTKSVYLFAVGNDGKIYKTSVVKDTSDGWAPVDAAGTVTFLPGASISAKGNSAGDTFVYLAAVARDGGIYSATFFELSGAWSAWSRVGALAVPSDSSVTLVGEFDSDTVTVRLFPVGGDGRVYEYRVDQFPSADWESIGDTKGVPSLPIAALKIGGAVSLYRAKETQVLTTSQASPDAMWEFSSFASAPLTLAAPQFDEEWQWLGSYSTFRAATFVFLYPENILQPSLLRDQTPAFQQLIANTRGQRLDAQSACQYAEEYASYFRDICSLEIEATCQASTISYTGEGCYRQPSTVPSMFYMFGRAPSGKIYWSAWSAISGDRQRAWEPVNGFVDASDTQNTKVIRIVGAMPYRGETSSFIYLFCISETTGNKTLRVARLNLDNFGVWDSSYSLTTPLPINADLEIVPVQSQRNLLRPGLVFHSVGSPDFYYSFLDKDGTGWEPGTADIPFRQNFPPGAGWTNIKAVIENDLLFWFILKRLETGIEVDTAELYILSGKAVLFVRAIDHEGEGFLGAVPGRETGFYLFYKPADAPTVQYLLFGFENVNHTVQQTVSDLLAIPIHSGTADAGQNAVVFKRAAPFGSPSGYGPSFDVYRYAEAGDILTVSTVFVAVPRVEPSLLNIPVHLTSTQLQDRRQRVTRAFLVAIESAADGTLTLPYLQEAFYFVPMHLALGLQSTANYLPALDCLRTIYDYEAPFGPPNQRNIYYGLELDAQLPDVTSYREPDGWWVDPLNPHSIAATRRFAYTRFTVMSVLRCMLDFADSEFTQDTPESLATARTLYLTSLDLLSLPELEQKLNVCEELISHLEIGAGKGIPPEAPAAVGRMLKLLKAAPRRIDNLGDTVRQVAGILKQPEPWKAKLSKAGSLITASVDGAPVFSTMEAALKARSADPLHESYARLLAQPGLDDKLQLVSNAVVAKVFDGAGQAVATQRDAGTIPQRARLSLAPNFMPILSFCIPPNPILNALRLRADLNLFKLRTCRNIAGLRRELNVYSAPTDTKSGLPSIGSGGQLLLPGTVTVLPSLYRYPALIERAKQLVQLAAQMEAAMLSAIEKEDAEKQTLLQAKQQLSLAEAGVQLQGLRVNEANDGIELANRQKVRAQIQIETYTGWLAVGANGFEKQMIEAYQNAAAAQKAATQASRNIQVKQSIISSAQLAAQVASVSGELGVITGPLTGGLNFEIDTALFDDQSEQMKKAIDATAAAQIASINAALERREDEWGLQARLAKQDSLIADQQKTIATDQVQVAKQELVIAGIQSDNAKDMVDFLSNKFTNVELFDWMSNVLEGVYRFFLQQATAMAKLAETQLAFERQEVPPATIMSDYWEPASDNNAVASVNATGPDRRGLTGSARLLQDIFQLDQYAFATNKRKLSLTKTISLARLVPAEFQRFRETGVLPFATPMEMFDRGFPGHYLRLIKRIQVNVVALVPAVQGIYATLSTTGPSRVVIGGDSFQTVPIQRAPEFLAISSASATSGATASDTQPDLLLPFEGSGVDMSWEFNMPKAANLFDYRTIADVIMTMEYTALYSPDYRQQVIQSFNPKLTADCALSFRNQFSDQWYDLNNPEQTATPMTVRFTTRDVDFPPNVEALQIQQVLLYFVRSNAASFEVPVTYLRYTAELEAGTVGGGATSIDGVISTRRGNAPSWFAMMGKSPIGEWELALPNTEEIRGRFKNDEIDDILTVITYSGRTPEWPA